MNKKYLHHWFARLRDFPKYIFLVLAVLFGVVAVFALRDNNQRMLELREAVFVADEQNGDIEGALRDLREHVYGHMNTNLSAGENAIKPPIQLKYEYERLVEQQKQQIDKANAELYKKAESYCKQQTFVEGSRIGGVTCVQQYVNRNGGSDVNVDAIDQSLYKFDFVSPTWSPDIAGWSIVLAIVFAGAFIGLFIIEYVLKHLAR